MEQLSKYQYKIGCKIAISDTLCDNYQSGRAIKETWFNFFFK